MSKVQELKTATQFANAAAAIEFGIQTQEATDRVDIGRLLCDSGDVGFKAMRYSKLKNAAKAKSANLKSGRAQFEDTVAKYCEKASVKRTSALRQAAISCGFKLFPEFADGKHLPGQAALAACFEGGVTVVPDGAIDFWNRAISGDVTKDGGKGRKAMKKLRALLASRKIKTDAQVRAYRDEFVLGKEPVVESDTKTGDDKPLFDGNSPASKSDASGPEGVPRKAIAQVDGNLGGIIETIKEDINGNNALVGLDSAKATREVLVRRLAEVNAIIDDTEVDDVVTPVETSVEVIAS